MDLSNLTPAKGSVKNRKRVGRGQGSGKGQTATRGNNGAKSRSGYRVNPGFEGGGLPIHRRIPKYGFKNRNRKYFAPVNLDSIQTIVDNHNVSEIDRETLVKYGAAPKKALVKILGRGGLNAKVNVKANAFSDSARKAIEENGGQAINL